MINRYPMVSLALLLIGMPLAADDQGAIAEVAEGKRLYSMHCTGCHGKTGKGDGALGHDLETEPPDLTQISQRNGGEFPADRVHQVIDGRLAVPAHGRREMPVWGFSFQTLARDTDQEAEVEARIEALTRFLETIQEDESE